MDETVVDHLIGIFQRANGGYTISKDKRYVVISGCEYKSCTTKGLVFIDTEAYAPIALIRHLDYQPDKTDSTSQSDDWLILSYAHDKYEDLPKEFIDAVDRVSTLSSDRTKAIKFKLLNSSLEISAENPDQGSAKENINVHYSGEELEIGFNSRYLLDIAKQISGAQIKFLLSDKLSPSLIFDDDDKQALYLLMPMHI